MKIIFAVLSFTIALTSCSNSADKTNSDQAQADSVKQKFFPVTSFIKGEIFEIKRSGINPVKYTMTNGKTDSVWLKVEDIDAAANEFLTPEIDSANMTSFFIEKSFLDQSINAITFTYDAKTKLPDSLKLKRWDIYIDPDAQKVKRIYMVKEISPSKTLQLTWVSGKWCKITTLSIDQNGVSTIEKEEKLNWDF